METVVNSYPILTFCPYLKLQRAHEFADFWIGPIDQFEGSWDPPALKDAARMLLGRFVTVDRKPVERPSLLASNKGAPTKGSSTACRLSIPMRSSSLSLSAL